MAAALHATARATAPELAGVISAANGGTLKISAGGITDLGQAWLAVGAVADGPPATYADFGSDFGGELIGMPVAMTIRYDSGPGEYIVNLPYTAGPGPFSAGDDVWLGLFLGVSAAPSSGAVPDAVAGPFTVVA